MKKITTSLQSIFYNILKNKPYTVFCVLGTALAFIFVTLILQLMRITTSSYPPMTNADRIIRMGYFQEAEGKGIRGVPPDEVNAFLETLSDFEHVAISDQKALNIVANGHLHLSGIGFVNADFWQVFDFELLYGRTFSNDDCTNRKTVMVITESVSRSFFNTTNSLGKKINLLQKDYEVIGVVKSPPIFVSPTQACAIWTPYVFRKFFDYSYTMDVLVPPVMPVSEAREKTSKAVQQYFVNKNVKVDFPAQKVQTLNEVNADAGNAMFRYGGAVALLLFLLIPALNILSLSATNTDNRAEEIAVRKAFGASRTSSFLLISAENLALTIVGAILGLALAVPVLRVIQSSIMQGSIMGDLSLVSGIDYGIIFIGVLPAAIVFSLLSGGIPAWLIAKRPAAHVLKGGSK